MDVFQNPFGMTPSSVRKLAPGVIVKWQGAVVDIPEGWALCDGTQGTPDLRNSFVPGAGDTYAVGATGGAVNHDHDFTGDGHAHLVAAGTDIADAANIQDFTTPGNATGTTDAGSTLAPYYSLAYIMEL